jgi:hypothetical protein
MSKVNEELFPKYLIADNSKYPNSLYIVHTEYPRFILNVSNDDICWLEEFNKADEIEVSDNSEAWIDNALRFYDSEIKSFE